ncbi:hypothetical protein [Vibrio sagamiensis]|uniref:Uncharacterized protein n=1 Tax=Vibrio sagamiensis NBRC 104589 TaxID=1219064 RepID=A0A511QKR1_9VIBR|nr:hypothetical protein [Vibrio sagamiensis]PNQ65366.1 hypothetical protein C1141_09265 [Vibrio agarivorans]GEM77636.1 hypothetical protein VSA01S_37480 [Vibrio sagamiensis NBRC 104589]
MKKTVLTTLALSLGVASVAMASDMTPGGATLQWAGSVPAVTTNGQGYYIIKEGTVDFNSGLLTFTNDTSGIALKSASQIGFKVVQDKKPDDGQYDPSVDNKPLNYKYSLVDVKVGIDGLPASQNPSAGYFAVHANGQPDALKLNDDQGTTQNGEPTHLTIRPNGTAPATLTGGSNVVVMSVLTVTPVDSAI